MAEKVIVDANPIISALLGGSARQVLFAEKFSFFSTQYTLFEVAKYLPGLAQRIGRLEIDLFREYELLPIIACQPTQYDSQLKTADALIGSRDEWHCHEHKVYQVQCLRSSSRRTLLGFCMSG